jgi:hypothetical protein
VGKAALLSMVMIRGRPVGKWAEGLEVPPDGGQGTWMFPGIFREERLVYTPASVGFSEVEANTFTGHSDNSHTALTPHFHLDRS